MTNTKSKITPVVLGILFMGFSSKSDPLEPPSSYLERTVVDGKDQYVDYVLGKDPKGRWEASICDVTRIASHFHKKGTAHFIVLEGKVAVTLDGKRHVFGPGGHVFIEKHVVHSFESVDPNQPARVWCITFPVYDPKDVYLPERSKP